MKILPSIIGAIIIGAALIYGISGIEIRTTEAPEVLGSISSQKCSVSSTLVASVGNQLSSTLLSANETRAWARIQQPLNASSSVSLSFDEGAAAVLNRGVVLSSASTTEQSTSVEFGRATHFPYTGAVTGISSTGSTTVLVTECSY